MPICEYYVNIANSTIEINKNLCAYIAGHVVAQYGAGR